MTYSPRALNKEWRHTCSNSQTPAGIG